MRKIFKAAIATLALTLSLCATAQQPERGYWRAASNTATGVTSDITISETKLIIGFKPYIIAPIRSLKPEEVSAVFDADASAAVLATVYRLDIPAAQKFEHKNTLCGSDDTHYMVTYTTGRTLQVAFFSGDAVPVFTFDAISHSTSLCGTFTYVR
ncbi:hypothetical protein [Terracidiphilus sp.]|jgi:hypothetical protein|uniref:hypothetical protein n=1 Tax=Terracidiphilus sp. TaxID=1964191 RepID=UPI003C1F5064